MSSVKQLGVVAALCATAWVASACQLNRNPTEPGPLEGGGASVGMQSDPVLGGAKPGLKPAVIITPPPSETPEAVCGNGRLEAGEACDPGLHTCCRADCGSAQAAGETCREATGDCDVEESCDGRGFDCPDDAVATATRECRAAIGVCDVAESCDGENKQCPDDALRGAATLCRAAEDACDAAEQCTGASADCPDDAVAPRDTVCRAAAPNLLCDAAERCDGNAKSCPDDAPATAGTICRVPAGRCDEFAACDGDSMVCPPLEMQVAPRGAVCRHPMGTCDAAEECDGVSPSCPADAMLPNTVACRSAVGTCDVVEACTGTSPTCPADVLRPNTFTCRSAAGACDTAEACTGSSGLCPGDRFLDAGMQCRGAMGLCDVAEQCTGASAQCPSDTVASTTTLCRAAEAGRVCDVPDFCNGTAKACPADSVASSTSVCRAVQSGDLCDVAERCSGTSKDCPTDAVATSTLVCRAVEAGDVCDVAERCNGTTKACPADGVASATTPCRPVLAGDICDLPENCDGTAKACPTDRVADSSVVCRPEASNTDCDVAEVCTGAKTCPADAVESSSVVCRVAADPCDRPDHCPGGSGASAKHCSANLRLQDGDACNRGFGACWDDVCCPGVTQNDGSGSCELDPGDNIVFVTSVDVTGLGTGGVSGAPELCTSIADDAGLAGTYHAWLSFDGRGPFAPQLVSSGPYKRVDGRVVASSAADLVDGALSAPIELTESGEPRRASVWTGTLATGVAAANATCSRWTSDTSSESGAFGESSASTAEWTVAGIRGCDQRLALYCVQDDCPGVPVVDFQNDEANCGACDTQCTAQQTCIQGRCGAYVFATSTTYAGSGLSNPDALCNERAQLGQIAPGSYRAWLSTDQVAAPSRVVDGAYFLLNGTLVADGVAHLLNASTRPLYSPIARDESGNTVQQTLFWTGTLANGQLDAGSNCAGWSERTGEGRVGSRDAQSGAWTAAGRLGCDSGAGLYCFQTSRTALTTTDTPTP